MKFFDKMERIASMGLSFILTTWLLFFISSESQIRAHEFDLKKDKLWSQYDKNKPLFDSLRVSLQKVVLMQQPNMLSLLDSVTKENLKSVAGTNNVHLMLVSYDLEELYEHSFALQGNQIAMLWGQMQHWLFAQHKPNPVYGGQTDVGLVKMGSGYYTVTIGRIQMNQKEHILNSSKWERTGATAQIESSQNLKPLPLDGSAGSAQPAEGDTATNAAQNEQEFVREAYVIALKKIDAAHPLVQEMATHKSLQIEEFSLQQMPNPKLLCDPDNRSLYCPNEKQVIMYTPLSGVGWVQDTSGIKSTFMHRIGWSLGNLFEGFVLILAIASILFGFAF